MGSRRYRNNSSWQSVEGLVMPKICLVKIKPNLKELDHKKLILKIAWTFSLLQSAWTSLQCPTIGKNLFTIASSLHQYELYMCFCTMIILYYLTIIHSYLRNFGHMIHVNWILITIVNLARNHNYVLRELTKVCIILCVQMPIEFYYIWISA